MNIKKINKIIYSLINEYKNKINSEDFFRDFYNAFDNFKYLRMLKNSEINRDEVALKIIKTQDDKGELISIYRIKGFTSDVYFNRLYKFDIRFNRINEVIKFDDITSAEIIDITLGMIKDFLEQFYTSTEGEIEGKVKNQIESAEYEKTQNSIKKAIEKYMPTQEEMKAQGIFEFEAWEDAEEKAQEEIKKIKSMGKNELNFFYTYKKEIIKEEEIKVEDVASTEVKEEKCEGVDTMENKEKQAQEIIESFKNEHKDAEVILYKMNKITIILKTAKKMTSRGDNNISYKDIDFMSYIYKNNEWVKLSENGSIFNSEGFTVIENKIEEKQDAPVVVEEIETIEKVEVIESIEEIATTEEIKEEPVQIVQVEIKEGVDNMETKQTTNSEEVKNIEFLHKLYDIFTSQESKALKEGLQYLKEIIKTEIKQEVKEEIKGEYIEVIEEQKEIIENLTENLRQAQAEIVRLKERVEELQVTPQIEDAPVEVAPIIEEVAPIEDTKKETEEFSKIVKEVFNSRRIYSDDVAFNIKAKIEDIDVLDIYNRLNKLHLELVSQFEDSDEEYGSTLTNRWHVVNAENTYINVEYRKEIVTKEIYAVTEDCLIPIDDIEDEEDILDYEEEIEIEEMGTQIEDRFIINIDFDIDTELYQEIFKNEIEDRARREKETLERLAKEEKEFEEMVRRTIRENNIEQYLNKSKCIFTAPSKYISMDVINEKLQGKMTKKEVEKLAQSHFLINVMFNDKKSYNKGATDELFYNGYLVLGGSLTSYGMWERATTYGKEDIIKRLKFEGNSIESLAKLLGVEGFGRNQEIFTREVLTLFFDNLFYKNFK
jgi:hypothetical protein